MKKSSLFVTLGILGAIVTLTAGNLKLKQEYNAGNKRVPYVEHPLAHFSYIRESLKSGNYYYMGINISDTPGQKPGVSIYFGMPDIYRFHVVNDTLLIESNPSESLIEGTEAPVYIRSSGLKELITTNGIISVNKPGKDSFFLKAGGRSQVNIAVGTLDNFLLETSAAAIVNLSGDTISHAVLELQDTSSLNINNLWIKQKTLLIGKGASLGFRGRPLDDFGIKKN